MQKLNHDCIRYMINAIDAMVFVVDQRRKILYTNDYSMGALGREDHKMVIGNYIGDVLQCENRSCHSDGCGSSQRCKKCKISGSIEEANELNSEVTGAGNLIIDRGNQQSMKNFKIKVTPIKPENKQAYIISLTDLSESKLLRDLEQIFFHDIINKTSAIRAFMGMMRFEDFQVEDYDFVQVVLDDIVGIIEMQKVLFDANRVGVHLHLKEVSTHALFDYMMDFFRMMDSGYEKMLILEADSTDVLVSTDGLILKRILINMIKNALEASSRSDFVKIGSGVSSDGSVEIWVKNKQKIHPEIVRELFAETVTTKKRGHGWGTHSMKFLGEYYLQGKLNYTTDSDIGTTFKLSLPRTIRREQ